MRPFAALRILPPCIALAACGPKAPVAPSAAAEVAPAITMDASGAAATFIGKWASTTVTNFTVASGSGGEVVYSTMSFTGAGTWSANATFEAQGEEFPCTESGTWAVASADSGTSATIEWTVAKTNCATRETGGTTRAAVTLQKNGDYDIAFR